VIEEKDFKGAFSPFGTFEGSVSPWGTELGFPGSVRVCQWMTPLMLDTLGLDGMGS